MRAYTLIELMVAVSIVLILSGTSIAAYLNFSKSQSMESDARQLVTELNRVRSLSEKLVYPSGCDSLLGYNIRSADLNGVRSAVIVTALCTPGNIIGDVQKILSSTYFSTPFDITFMPGTGYSSAAVVSDITIVNTVDMTTNKAVSVSTLGIISVNTQL